MPRSQIPLAGRLLSLAFMLAAPSALAQSPPPSCDTLAHAGLDFWVGDWAATWNAADGTTGRGTSTIARILDGCVVHERFASEDGFAGESVSVFDARTGWWRQTWVNNRGGYLLFTGRPEPDGAVALYTEPFTNPEGQEQVNRMTWRGVSAEGFDWHWQRSLDGGATWEDRWVIHYTRR
jgi:hypothetical protein